MHEESDVLGFLGEFEGEDITVRAPLSYRVAVLIVGLVMLVLPRIYLAICAAVAWVVCLHAVGNTELLSAGGGRGRLFAILLYLASIVIGGVLVLFMFKPLFTRSVRREARVDLDQDRHPWLFAFVEKVCDTVGASRPKRIRARLGMSDIPCPHVVR